MADNGHHESDERTTDDIFSAYVATELLWSILPGFFFFTDPGLASLNCALNAIAYYIYPFPTIFSF